MAHSPRPAASGRIIARAFRARVCIVSGCLAPQSPTSWKRGHAP